MISVCLITYNGEKHINEQLDSILCQLSSNDEIVVSDDGSTDRTLSIIRDYNDNRLRIIKNTGKQGVIGNVENALREAKGDYIFLADQDDVWLPNKVKKSLRALENTSLVVSDCYVTDSALETTHDSFHKLNKSPKNRWIAFLKNPYIGCCMAFNRKVLEKSLPFPESIPMHDIWIGNIAAFYYKAQIIPDRLILYRRHGHNTSTASEASQTSLLQKLTFRLTIAYQLLKRLK